MDDMLTVVVRVTMTAEQRDAYREEYGSGDYSVGDDVFGRLSSDVAEALKSCYWLREFTTVSVSNARHA